MSALSDKIRIEWKENDAKRDAGLTTPEDVVRFDDLSYGPYEKWNVLDVYRPKGVEGKLPVIVSVHGGGWVYGDKELYQFYCMSLAQRGFAVVNFTYRLAPEYQYPAPLEDTNRVIEWMYENKEKYGFDMENVFMVGDSAGGHLAGLYGVICTNPEYAERFAFKVPGNFVPKGLGLNCGAYVPIDTDTIKKAELLMPEMAVEESEKKDEVNSEEPDTDGDLMYDFLTGHGTIEEAEEICVPMHITSAYPPVFLMTAVGDFCKVHVPPMEAALKEHKVSYIYKEYGNEKNPLYHVFHVTIQDEDGQKCNDEQCAFFKSLM